MKILPLTLMDNAKMHIQRYLTYFECQMSKLFNATYIHCKRIPVSINQISTNSMCSKLAARNHTVRYNKCTQISDRINFQHTVDPPYKFTDRKSNFSPKVVCTTAIQLLQVGQYNTNVLYCSYMNCVNLFTFIECRIPPKHNN